MKGLYICAFMLLSSFLFAQRSPYAVQVGAFDQRISLDYFNRLENVYETYGNNQIYRYYIDAPDLAEAERIKNNAVKNGHPFARVIDFNAIAKKCDSECGFTPPAETGIGMREGDQFYFGKGSEFGISTAETYSFGKKSTGINISDADQFNIKKSSKRITIGDADQFKFNSNRTKIGLNNADQFKFKEGDLPIKCIFFDYDATHLKSDSKKELNKLATILRQRHNYKLWIYAHADADGSNNYNDNLSSKRAQSVYAYLRKNGVSSSQIAQKYYGETLPIAKNSAEAGKQFNRRVELVVLDQKGNIIDIIDEIEVPRDLIPE